MDFKRINQEGVCYFDEKENVKKYIVFLRLKKEEEIQARLFCL